MKKFLALLLALVMVLAFSACGTTPAPEPAPEAEPEATPEAEPEAEPEAAPSDIIIGFSQATMASPFYVTQVESAQAAAEAAGITLMVADANEDITKQNQDITDLLEAGIQALVLNAVDPDGVAPSIEACKAAGVPVITVDRFVNADIDCVLGRDNEYMGQLVGESIVEYLGGAGQAQGVVLELYGSAGDRVQEARSKGFHNAVDKEAGITVIQSPYCNYVRSMAATATQDIIQTEEGKLINVIYGHNDDMALGGLQVCLDAGMSVMGSGVDGLMEAVDAIADGTYIATTSNDPSVFGTKSIEVALMLINGEDPGAEVDCGTLLIDSSNAAAKQTDAAFATIA